MQGWTLPAETRTAMRLDHIRKLLEQTAWHDAALEAEELLDEAPDHVQALDCLARAQLGMLDAEGAVLTWTQLFAQDQSVIPERLAGYAMALFDTCQLDAAIEAASKAADLDPALAEAHYVRGLALEFMPGKSAEAATALVAAHRLDPVSFPFPMSIDSDTWERAIMTAMLQVSPPVRALWEGVPVRLVESPELERLKSSQPPLTPRLPGLFHGDAPSMSDDPPEDPWSRKPELLWLFTKNVSRVHSVEELIGRIADLLEQEAMVWVGEDPWLWDGSRE